MRSTRSILVTGYSDRNDGPSVFIDNLTNGLSKEFNVNLVSNRFSFQDLICVLRADILILNSCNLMPLLIFSMWPLVSRKKIISVIHGEMGSSLVPSFKKNLLKLCEKKMLSLANSIVFVSKIQLDIFSQRYPNVPIEKKSFVIPNGIVNNITTASKKEKIIIYVGGESLEKGRKILDEVIADLSVSKRLQGYSILLFGMNEEYDVAVNNVRVISKKRVQHSVMLEYFSKSEVFLSLSPFETFGIACIEAFLLNNKIVCYERCGFLEVVKDNCFVSDRYESLKFSQLVKVAINTKISPVEKTMELLSVEKMIHSYREIIYK